MEFYFDSQPSTSTSIAANGETQKIGDVSQNGNQEQQSSCRTKETLKTSLKVGSVINEISSRAQELVEKNNNRQAKDLSELESFQEQLVDKVNEICRQMKENMYAAYEQNSDEMQVKLQELTDVLERCTKLNSDLKEGRQLLSCLNEGLEINTSSDSD